MDINFIISHNSQRAAMDAGVDRYFTGETCKRGHMSDRYTATANCVECHAMRSGRRQTVPIDPHESPVPACLKGRATLAPCLKCARFSEPCKGRMQTTQLARATFAFPEHGHVSARAAREAGVGVYHPPEPCETCGRHSWRTLAGKCGECDADARMPWRTWTDEQKAANERAWRAAHSDPARIRAADEANKD